MTAPAPSPATEPTWADRGWYLAIEYGVLARDRFLKRLPHLREQGRFKELLEPGGKILYRNLFRASEVKEAWEAITALQPWKDRLTCYLMGEEVALSEVHDVLWCAAFLQAEGPCRGGREQDKVRWVGCEGAKIRLSAGVWDLNKKGERHVWHFASATDSGSLAFDRAAIADYVRGRGRGARCPASPAGDPEAFAAVFEDVSLRAIGWPVVAVLSEPVSDQLGDAREREQGVTLKKGEAIDPHGQFELCWKRGGTWLVDPTNRKQRIGASLRLDPEVEKVVEAGTRLRVVRTGEDYVRLEGGHYDLEQRLLISTRVNLGPTDRCELFKGYTFETYPRATPLYSKWVGDVASRLK